MLAEGGGRGSGTLSVSGSDAKRKGFASRKPRRADNHRTRLTIVSRLALRLVTRIARTFIINCKSPFGARFVIINPPRLHSRRTAPPRLPSPDQRVLFSFADTKCQMKISTRGDSFRDGTLRLATRSRAVSALRPRKIRKSAGIVARSRD